MTLVFVTERLMSMKEVKARLPLMGAASTMLDQLLAANKLPARDACYFTTLLQPTKFRKTWQPTKQERLDAHVQLLHCLVDWAGPGQYPAPVVVPFGKVTSALLIDDFDYDDDFHVPRKRYGDNHAVFPMAAEAADFYKAKPSARLIQGFARLARFVL